MRFRICEWALSGEETEITVPNGTKVLSVTRQENSFPYVHMEIPDVSQWKAITLKLFIVASGEDYSSGGRFVGSYMVESSTYHVFVKGEL